LKKGSSRALPENLQTKTQDRVRRELSVRGNEREGPFEKRVLSRSPRKPSNKTQDRVRREPPVRETNERALLKKGSSRALPENLQTKHRTGCGGSCLSGETNERALLKKGPLALSPKTFKQKHRTGYGGSCLSCVFCSACGLWPPGAAVYFFAGLPRAPFRRAGALPPRRAAYARITSESSSGVCIVRKKRILYHPAAARSAIMLFSSS